MKQWEYQKIISANIKADELNGMGAAGWEHYHVDGNAHYFKKCIEPEPVEMGNPLEEVATGNKEPATNKKKK